MKHPLAVVHAHMPATLRAETPLSELPRDATWETSGRTGPKTWCEADRHAGRQVPSVKFENILHEGVDDNGYPFQDLYAGWNTCMECHEALVAERAEYSGR